MTSYSYMEEPKELHIFSLSHLVNRQSSFHTPTTALRHPITILYSNKENIMYS